MTDARVASFKSTVCGVDGGFDRLNKLLGDFWGSSNYSSLISDSSLQDINIVTINPGASAGWAGYFWGGNNYKRSSYATSNEALVFFINSLQVANSINYALSTLIHEATHMINFYQRAVVRGVYHDTWLEETSAMMSEDIIVPTVVNGYSNILTSRISGYLNSGAVISYDDWSFSWNSYSLGGAFGAYLNRHYGLGIFKQLITNCGSSSYTCLDALIKNNGGTGFQQAYGRFGATIFGTLPATNIPSGFGYPAKSSDGYALQPFDLSSSTLPYASSSYIYQGVFPSTSHSFTMDTVASGKANYVRSGVIVPPHTNLVVLVK